MLAADAVFLALVGLAVVLTAEFPGTVKPASAHGPLGGDVVQHTARTRLSDQPQANTPNIVIQAPIVILGSAMASEVAQQVQQALQHALAGLRPMLAPPLMLPVRQPAQGLSGAELGLSYQDYCLDDTLELERPFGRSIEPSTFQHEQRLLQQLDRAGIPLAPPDWAAFQSWVNEHPRGKAGCDNHRRAYARYCGYHGITVPAHAKRRWDSKKAVERGRRAGTLRARERFFRNGPWDVLRVLRAEPFRDPVLNEAFHHVVNVMAVTGPRSGEPRFLRVEDVEAERRSFRNWWQEKKDVTRTIQVPEPWLWDGPGPTVKRYLERTRPQLAARARKRDESTYFLSSQGRPYASDQAWASFVRTGVVKTLGYTIGPHAFRRFNATLRYVYGWSIEEVADFLDDTTQAVRQSYIDDGFVAKVGRRNLNRRGDARPALPPLWNLPKALDLDLPDPPISKTSGPKREKVEAKI